MQPSVAELVHHSTRATLATCVNTGNGQTVCTTSSAGAVLAVFGLVYLAVIVVSIVATVKVVTKAGYSGWWALIMFVPLANFVMMLVFAFSKWPVLREVDALRAQVGGGRWPGPMGGGLATGGFGFAGPAGQAAGVPGEWPPSPSGPSGRVPVESDVPLPSFWGPRLSGPTDEAGAEPAPTPPSAGPPPGWYPTPEGRQRYWDGTAWTDHFA